MTGDSGLASNRFGDTDEMEVVKFLRILYSLAIFFNVIICPKR